MFAKGVLCGATFGTIMCAVLGTAAGTYYLDKYAHLSVTAMKLNDEVAVLRQIHIQYDAPPLTDSTMPVGIRNNNPMNVKGTGWKGQLDDRAKTDKFGHAVFLNAHYGLRAGARNLINMQERSGCDTIRKLVDKYCQTKKEEYITALCMATGLEPDEQFDMKEHLYSIMKTIVRQENGQDPYPESYYVPYTFLSNS